MRRMNKHSYVRFHVLDTSLYYFLVLISIQVCNLVPISLYKQYW